MKYGYARVSTKGQAADGNSLENQIELLEKAGAEIIYKDVFSGTKLDRPELNKLLKILKPDDTIIITKLDRFARSIGQASELITNLIDNGIKVEVLNLGVLDNSSVSTLFRNMLLAFAQFERDMIVERTQEGKAVARRNPNYREGRKKKYTDEQIKLALKLLETYSYSQVTEMTGISKSTLIRAKKNKIKRTINRRILR
ncbi:MAG: recombinase family protein [Saccharofermentanales bacterium]